MIHRDLTCWFCVRGECEKCAIPRVCACRKCHLVMDCDPVPIVPLIEYPEEGETAVKTLKAFLARRAERDGAK